MSGSILDRGGLRSPFERDDELVFLMGQVTTVWGAIGHLFRSVGAELLGADYEDANVKLSAIKGDGGRLTMLIGQADEGSEVRVILQKLKDLVDERNRIVHGGPLYGERRDRFTLGLHIVNFGLPEDVRYEEAKPFVTRHLAAVRGVGGELFDYANRNGLLALDDTKEAIYPL